MAPVTYYPGFVSDPELMFTILWRELPWERRDDAPRFECWMTDLNAPYTYGRGVGSRTYQPSDWHPLVRDIRARIAETHAAYLEACFCNGYRDEADSLGWHADDSPEIDDRKPIAVVSFGAAREIWFKPIGAKGVTNDRLLLEPGSLVLMAPDMQNQWLHRIPKVDRAVGPRLSLTYRGLVPQH